MSEADKIKIQKGDQSAYIIRESLEVWQDKGWKEVKPDKDESLNPEANLVVKVDSEKK